ncbi:unnamed protein product [Lactuca saligna]|uniref:Uncharacterized protein n=1 Tax=Lactuca saligna TaxID=75948 RepID=A0AA35UR08_LACSI|nr:unnamed protein product [Lactuca saligna]
MPSVTLPRNSWFFEDWLHLPANNSIVGEPQDIQITLLQLHLEVSLIREEVNADQRELRESLSQDMDAMNRKVDNVRACVLKMSHLADDLTNHFYSLQPAYVRASTEIAKMKKMLAVTSVFGVVAIVEVVAAYRWFS